VDAKPTRESKKTIAAIKAVMGDKLAGKRYAGYVKYGWPPYDDGDEPVYWISWSADYLGDSDGWSILAETPERAIEVARQKYGRG